MIESKVDGMRRFPYLPGLCGHACACMCVCVCRCVQRERGLAGVRHSHPQADAAALRVAAEGAPPRHPVGPQRDGQDPPGQSAVSTPAAAGGTTPDPARHHHLQRGPQVQQGGRKWEDLCLRKIKVSGPVMFQCEEQN